MKKRILAFVCAMFLALPALSFAAEKNEAVKAGARKGSVVTTQTAGSPASVPEEPRDISIQKMVPVSFIVLDQTGYVTAQLRREWRQSVRQAYHVPYYQIQDNDDASLIARQIIGANTRGTDNLDAGVFQEIAEESNTRVVTLMIIHEMEQQMLHGLGSWRDGPETYIRTYTAADLYVYKADTKELKKKIIRDIDTRDMGNDVKPSYIIKYAMMNLVNKMEGRPQI